MSDAPKRTKSKTAAPVRGWNYALPAPGELRVLRLKAGLSQHEAAEHVGVSRQTIHAWEDGDVSPSLETTRKLLGLFRAEICGDEL